VYVLHMRIPPNSFFAMQKALNDGRSAPLAAFAQKLRSFDLGIAVAAIGGLQLLPHFQASTYRIEALAHAAVAACNGRRPPRRRDLAAWLTEVGSICGPAEDPAEDVFCGRVIFEGRNYNVLEGLSEAGCYHLQLILNVVEGMPESYRPLKDECLAGLALADAMCARAGIVPHQVGAEHPVRRKVTDAMLRPVREIARWATFTIEQIHDLGVSLDALERFFLAPKEREVLSKPYGTSDLYTKPLLLTDANLIVALPTALGHAIRSLVIQTCKMMGQQSVNTLRAVHLQKICEELFDSPTFGLLPISPIELTLQPVVATAPAEIEPGYWVQIVLIVDDLEGFEVDGLMGTIPDNSQIEQFLEKTILDTQEHCEARPDFKAGISVFITCGFGRGYELRMKVPEGNWFVETASDYDATVLTWRTDFEVADILRLAMTERDLGRIGFETPRLNGLLGKVADATANRGHLIPHELLEDGWNSGTILMPQNSQLAVRQEYHQRNDIRAITDPGGSVVRVRRVSGGRRSPGRTCRLYASTSEARIGRVRAVWIQNRRNWWIETSPLSSTSTRPCIRSFMALEVWFERAAIILDDAFPDLPDQMSWELHIDPQPPMNVEELVPADTDEIEAAILLNSHLDRNLVQVVVQQDFWRGMSQPDNRAERALVSAFVLGSLRLVGSDEAQARLLVDKIVVSPAARQLHAFAPQDFRDHVRAMAEKRVVHVSKFQDAALRIGLGWSGVPRPGGTVTGVQACTQALNAIAKSAETALCNDLAQFNLRSLVQTALANNEAAEIEARRWRMTAPAIIALSEDIGPVSAEIAESLFKLNGVTLACRNLMEIGLHHCSPDGGFLVADIDLARLMARAMMVVHLGGYSDAIHYGAMRPEIRVSPAGEVQIDASFFDGIMDPIGRELTEINIERQRRQYHRNLKLPVIPDKLEPSGLDPSFEAAWKAEFGSSLMAWRLAVDAFENICMEHDTPWLVLPRPDLIKYLNSTLDNDAEKILEQIESIPRTDWRTVPVGFDDSDRQIWRFRRRLSVARRPLLRLGFDETSDVLVAPGLIRECFVTTTRNMFEGNYDRAKLSSDAMRRWKQKTADQEGRKFEVEVCERMKGLGWTAMTGKTFGEILGRAPALDHGDIDVLAWNDQGRIVLMECKSLTFAKTPGEVAKQLAEFRGEVGAKGKPDSLAKHLRRWNLAKDEAESFARFTGLKSPRIEAALVFSNPVPMKYALDNMSASLWVGTKSDLDGI
jgi:hypothetical protein